MLCRTAPILVDAGYETQLHNMLHRAGLPDNLSDISSCDSAPIASTPLPAQPEVDDAAYSSAAFEAAISAFDAYVGLGQVCLIYKFCKFYTGFKLYSIFLASNIYVIVGSYFPMQCR